MVIIDYYKTWRFKSCISKDIANRVTKYLMYKKKDILTFNT